MAVAPAGASGAQPNAGATAGSSTNGSSTALLVDGRRVTRVATPGAELAGLDAAPAPAPAGPIASAAASAASASTSP